MLRASIDETGAEYDLTTITGKARGDGDIAHAQLLADFAEAVTLRDDGRAATLRNDIAEALGPAALVDAAAVAAAFHGFVRIADASGAPPEGAAGGRVTMEFRDHVGINEFYGAQNP
jgi:hypothetical protein